MFFRHKKKDNEKMLWFIIMFVSLILAFNQYQISTLADFVYSGSSNNFVSSIGSNIKKSLSISTTSFEDVDISKITSTQMAVKLLFPELNKAKTEQDFIDLMIPEGTPEYSEALGGISFDDPVTSMEYLAKWYFSLSQEIKQNDPEVWQRYLNLAAAPRGISCEFCCGVGPQGITSQGQLRCGCKHNPAVQALTLGLMKYTDYNDVQILREVMKWKTIFFPRNMVQIGMQVAGTDASSLKALPGMVGGC